MRRRKGQVPFLTAMELAFIENYAGEGSGTAAARAAGSKNPEKYAEQVLKKPSVLEALRLKQATAVKASGRTLARALSKINATGKLLALVGGLDDVDVVSDLLAIGRDKTETAEDRTRALKAAGEIVTASLKLVADIEGYIIKKTQALPEDFDAHTDEEKDFFAARGYWPPAETGSLPN